ncbi:hypothetical protein [Pseudomonas sp. BMS12]|uniref:hypothetical protein n=1 Tax=Pseudomonas sp. BMS12 TaxID=1796033 RepID=UPI00083AC71E|nr:hypothetical protein [Pseudomonas sp. BMS12]
MVTETQLALVASLLRRGRNLDRLSTGLTLLALAYGLAALLGATQSATASLLCGLLLMLGLAQKYWALRVALDAELFQHLADTSTELPQRTADLDQALLTLGLQAKPSSPRDGNQRSHGALRLLRLQAAWLVAQLLLALAIILVMPWLSLAG